MYDKQTYVSSSELLIKASQLCYSVAIALNLLFKLVACTFQVADEVKYIKSLTADRTRELDDLRFRMNDMLASNSNQKKVFEDEIQSFLSSILASDDSRRASIQLAYDEEQQSIAVSQYA